MPKKKGHTRIPHKLMEAICSTDFTLAELKVLLVGIRKIMGWKEKRKTMMDRISLSQFSECTGLTSRAISKALKKLEKRAIFTPVLQGGKRYSGRRATCWHFDDNPDSWVSLERMPVPSMIQKRVERPFPLPDEKTHQKESENTQNGPGWNARSTQGGTSVPSKGTVERTPVPPQKKSIKETNSKKRRAARRLASLIQKTFRTSLQDPDFKLNDTELEIIHGVTHRYSTSSPELLSASFRNFLGVREEINRRTIPLWAEIAGATLPPLRDRKGMKRIEVSGA